MAPRRPLAPLAVVVLALSGCALVAGPTPPPIRDSSLAPTGPLGYVVCPAAVTPVELDSLTAEAAIPLPVSSPAPPGDAVIATAPDGRWAYVATTAGGAGGGSELVPIDLEQQAARRPVPLPPLGATHAVVVLHGGRTVVVGDGTALVPVDVASRRVGRPIELGTGHDVYGLAVAPDGTTLYALVPGAVVAVDTVHGSAGPEVPTGLAISSVYSPHGIAVTADGSTIYVVGQGGADFGGRVVPILTATRSTSTPAGFDRYGIADPAALALGPGGASLEVVDNANNWVNPVVIATFTDPPPPVRLPPPARSTSGTGHPTDIVAGPDGNDFIVVGFSSMLPYNPSTQTFGRPVAVCPGASSMAVAPAP